MFSYIVAVCMAIDITGEPKNPCWMQRGDTIYRTIKACEQAANLRKARMAKQIIDDHGVSPVISIVCGDYEGS